MVSRLRAVQAGVRAAYGDDAWVPPAEMGVDDAEITTVIDVTPFWEDKLAALAALAAHASQPDAALLVQLLTMAGDSAENVARVEEYVQAYPPVGSPVSDVERDFFDTETSV